MKSLQLALSLLLVALSTGCYTTTIISGKPASPATVAYNARWHHGVVFGMGEVSGPYNLQEICPQGWAEIETEQSFVNSIVSMITDTLYTPQSVTIRCSAAAAPMGSPMPQAPAVAPAAPLAPPPPAVMPPPVTPQGALPVPGTVGAEPAPATVPAPPTH
jgi:hypothetical protein